jgi:hypothetical protein
MGLPLRVIPGRFALTKLPPGEPVPEGILRAEFCFVARTPTELSIVAPEYIAGVGGAGAFRLICIAMTFGTTESGILKQVIDPLAADGIWVLALGTHDTDYILVREDQFHAAVGALIHVGHVVED